MPPESAPTRFSLIRHAPTEWNRDKRIQGQQDSELTRAGTSLCRRWGAFLATGSWQRILSSDLGRAVKTAALINQNLKVPLTRTSLLREMNWGDWTGKTLKQIKAEVPEVLFEMERAGWSFRPPGGEDRIAVWQRAQQALIRAAQSGPGESILVVTHEGVIKCLVYRLLQRRFLPEELPLLKAGHVHTLICDQGNLVIETINARALPV